MKEALIYAEDDLFLHNSSFLDFSGWMTMMASLTSSLNLPSNLSTLDQPNF